MQIYNLLLFILTLAGGSLPLLLRGLDEKNTNYLLAFSGSFLLSITLLHLLPETFERLGHPAGIFLLAGFFLQLLLQRITHGVEHGHTHIRLHQEDTDNAPSTHNRSVPLLSIILGLSLHAFMEGLPLGFNFKASSTISSLYLAVAAHKLPEAMLLASIVYSLKGKRQALLILLFFSLITPAASMLAYVLGRRYFLMSEIIMWLIPVVAGAFIHISTTIFFESGTRQHKLTWQKIMSILLGVSAGLTTLLFE